MENSRIGWTDNTFNPWWGCTKVSPGCLRCYAATLDKRTGGQNWGATAPRKRMSDGYWAKPLAWDRKAAKLGIRFRVFCASMADVFEDRTDLMADRERLWHLIRRTPNLDWLLLTKRPENIEPLLRLVTAQRGDTAWDELADGRARNVWLGATVEGRATLHRAEVLSLLPAAVRFLSMEPLLEAVVPPLRRCERCRGLTRDALVCDRCGEQAWAYPGMIDWVIVGGESGPGARPFDVAWARSIITECHNLDVPVYVKQLGARPIESEPDDGPEWPVVLEHDNSGNIVPLLRSTSGEDWDEWPADLRVRQFPRGVAA